MEVTEEASQNPASCPDREGMTAKYESKCHECGLNIRPGDEIVKGYKGRYRHSRCRRSNLLRGAAKYLASHSPEATLQWLAQGYAHAAAKSDEEEYQEALTTDYLEVFAWVRSQ
jgi:hypothetical protein